jgi:hypothetical protein
MVEGVKEADGRDVTDSPVELVTLTVHV